MKEQSGNFNFCPRCGALTRDGVCQSCGYRHEITNGGNPQNDMQLPYIPQEPHFRIPEEERRKKNLNIAAVIAGVIGGMVLFVCVIVGVFAAGKIAVAMKESRDYYEDGYYEDDYYEEYPQEEYGTGDDTAEAEVFDIVPFDAEQYLTEEDYFLSRDYRNEWGGNHANHARTEFSGTYYENVCDSIDYNVPYQIVRKYGEYKDPRESLTMRYTYLQLEGDIPNIETLNQEIKADSIEFAEYYYSQYLSGPEEYADMYVEADSYVTFNDSGLLSIALNQQVTVGEWIYSDLRGINIDLETGSILTNSEILEINTQFAEDYKNRSLEQNDSIPFMEEQSAESVRDYLIEDDYNILFYTPMGMEVGYNYYSDTSSGWVTVTYKDYQDYLQKVS